MVNGATPVEYLSDSGLDRYIYHVCKKRVALRGTEGRPWATRARIAGDLLKGRRHREYLSSLIWQAMA